MSKEDLETIVSNEKSKSNLDGIKPLFSFYKPDRIRAYVAAGLGIVADVFLKSPGVMTTVFSLLNYVAGPSNASKKILYKKLVPKAKFKKDKFSFNYKQALFGLGIFGSSILVDYGLGKILPNKKVELTPEKIAVLGISCLAMGHIFYDFVSYYVKRGKQYIDSIRLSFVKDKTLIANKLYEFGNSMGLDVKINEYYKSGNIPKALNIFFQNLDNKALSKPFMNLDNYRLIYGEKNNIPKSHLLAFAISQKWSEEFIFGLIDEIHDESLNNLKNKFSNEDLTLLALTSHYQYLKGHPDASSSLSSFAKIIFSNYDKVNKELFSQASSDLYSVAGSDLEDDYTKTLNLLKVREGVSFEDSLLISDYCNKNNSDSNTRFAQAFAAGKYENLGLLSLRTHSGSQLSDLIKQVDSPETLNHLLSSFNNSSLTVKNLFSDLHKKGIVNFDIKNTSKYLSSNPNIYKDSFNLDLAKKINERNSILSEFYDFLSPSIDNLFEQDLVSNKNSVFVNNIDGDLIFTRLDLDNNGFRYSVYDFVNPSFFLEKNLDKLFREQIINFQLNELSKTLNIELDKAATYLAYSTIERTNHLIPIWANRPHQFYRVKEVLDHQNIMIDNFSKFLSPHDKSLIFAHKNQLNDYAKFHKV